MPAVIAAGLANRTGAQHTAPSNRTRAHRTKQGKKTTTTRMVDIEAAHVKVVDTVITKELKAKVVKSCRAAGCRWGY